MRNVLIVQKTNKALSLNESAVVNGDTKYNLGGIFTEFGVVNRNDRIYTAEKFLPAMNEMKERIDTLGVVYGEFDHPDVFDTSLQKASHIIRSIDYVAEKNCVEGSIQLLSTYWGTEAKAIVNDGHPLFVSSRAAGVTEGDGSVALKKLFTYDIVADPGFGSARMSSINESCGYSGKSDFEIYAMNDESKINELFNMNKNDMVTKTQLAEYSGYLVDELGKTRNKVNEAVKVGKLDNTKMEELLSYYENLQEDHTKLVEYLDYLGDKISVVVKENKSLKETQSKLIKHNDYIAENLEKSINYTEYVAENLDTNISKGEKINEKLDKLVDYSEYLAENLDSNIAYSEYIAENLDSNIAYSEYIAENLDTNISSTEKINEDLKGSIAYAEYIAEHLDDNIAYSDYIAENLDKSISYQSKIVEKLNGNKLFESVEDEDERFPLPEEEGFEIIDELELEDGDLDGEVDTFGDETLLGDFEAEADIEAGENCHVVCDSDEEAIDLGDDQGDFEETPLEVIEDEGYEGEEFTDEVIEDEFLEEEEEVECDCGAEGCNCNDIEEETDLDSKIDKLIEEAKKRKASETNEHHFLKFLNKSQVNSFYGLENGEQEKVVAYINEKANYMSDGDVLRLMQEALSIRTESFEEKLVRLMPTEVKAKWDRVTESKKVSLLSQARLYPELVTESQIENFWLTRTIKVQDTSKKLLTETKYIQEDKLSDEAIEGIMERFKNL